MLVKPNFFILGAPKCGTTSLAAWLSEHPNVFVTKPKEPEFFNGDIAPFFKGGVRKYESLYRSVDEKHVAIGEASTVYLRSAVAVQNILTYQPDAKFIVGVRNPVNMFFSWHGQMLRNGWETETSPRKAWELQQERLRGNNVPALCPDVKHLVYGEVCALGAQLKNLLDLVGPERCYVYSLDEMSENEREVWSEVCEFIGVSESLVDEFPLVNEGVEIPLWVAFVARIVDEIKRRLGLRWYRFGVMNKLKNRASSPMARVVDQVLELELTAFFEEDIALLKSMTGRFLTK